MKKRLSLCCAFVFIRSNSQPRRLLYIIQGRLFTKIPHVLDLTFKPYVQCSFHFRSKLNFKEQAANNIKLFALHSKFRTCQSTSRPWIGVILLVLDLNPVEEVTDHEANGCVLWKLTNPTRLYVPRVLECVFSGSPPPTIIIIIIHKPSLLTRTNTSTRSNPPQVLGLGCASFSYCVTE